MFVFYGVQTASGPYFFFLKTFISVVISRLGDTTQLLNTMRS